MARKKKNTPVGISDLLLYSVIVIILMRIFIVPVLTEMGDDSAIFFMLTLASVLMICGLID